MQKIELSHPIFRDLVCKISEVAGLIHGYGWAEANAGNLSIEVSELIRQNFGSPGRWFIVSRSGSRYRQTALTPHDSLVLVSCLEDHDVYYPPDAKATSEWISHRTLQLANDRFNTILHTHPAEIIALAAYDAFRDSQTINRIFADILPELPLYLPEGVAICPHKPPGSIELCNASRISLSDQKALIWTGHGLLTFANCLDDALDYQEIVVKAAKILFLSRK